MENKVISREYVEKNYISIKDLKKVLEIEEFDNIDVLSHISTLMSEVNRLEDIEDRKVQIECQLIFDKGVKSVEDKIKEKIKELEKYVNDFEEYWSKDPRQFKKEKCIDYYKLEALKELLQGGQESDQEGG